MLNINRRDFLKGSAALGVAGAISGTVLNTLRPSTAAADESPAATWKPTGCLGCTTWCAIEAKVQTEGGIERVVDVRGHRYAKTHEGYACPRARLAIQELYDADRIKVPMKRTATGKGRTVAPKFVPYTGATDALKWDAAITDIAKKMLEKRYTPDAYNLYTNPKGGIVAVGTASGGTATTLTTSPNLADGSKGFGWGTDYYKGMYVQITSGPGAPQKRVISGNTANALTVTSAWTVPTAASQYKIYPYNGMATGGTTTTLTFNPAGVTSKNDIYKGMLVKITSGTGMGSIRLITTNTGNTLTVEPAFTVAPNATSKFEIWPSKAHKSLFIRGRYVNGGNELFYSKLPAVYGTPNYISHSSLCAESEKPGWGWTNGNAGYQDYDIDNCKCLLLWGVDPVSSNRLVSGMIAKLGERLAAGMKLIVVDPRMSPSAGKAHRWLPVKPGGDAALALAMAKWIIENSMRNTAFTAVSGLTEFTAYLATLSMADLATACGIDELTIKKTACEFAGYDYDGSGVPTGQNADRTGDEQCKAISWFGPGIAMQPNGVYGGFAAAALNGLVGSFDHVGGVMQKSNSVSPSMGSLASETSRKDVITGYPGAKINGQKRTYVYGVTAGPEYPIGLPGITKNAVGAVKPSNLIADSLNSGGPYGCEFIMSWYANWVYSCSGAKRWESALSRSGIYQVHIGTNPSEQAWFCDVVLPANHATFESFCYTSGARARGYFVYALANRCATKHWATKDCEEVVWLLAKKMATIGVGTVVSGWPTTYYFTKLSDYMEDNVAGAADEAAFNEGLIKRMLVNNDDTLWAKLTSTDPADYSDTGSYDVHAGKAIGYGIRQATYGDGNEGTTAYYDVNGRGLAWNQVSGKTFTTKSGMVEFGPAGSGAARSGHSVDGIKAHAATHSVTYKDVLTACGYDMTAAAMTTTNDDAANDIAFMPHWEDPLIQGDEATYPFIFVDAKSRLNREGRTGNTQWYYEFKQCDAGDSKWSDVLKINPADGATYGIPDGAKVTVSSPSNTTGITCRVKWSEGVRQGVAQKAYGQGHWAYGRLAAGKSTFNGTTNAMTREEAGNNNELMPVATERIACGNARNCNTRVKITPIGSAATLLNDYDYKQ